MYVRGEEHAKIRRSDDYKKARVMLVGFSRCRCLVKKTVQTLQGRKSQDRKSDGDGSALPSGGAMATRKRR